MSLTNNLQNDASEPGDRRSYMVPPNWSSRQPANSSGNNVSYPTQKSSQRLVQSPHITDPLSDPVIPPDEAMPLTNLPVGPAVTRRLNELQTNAKQTLPLREPIVIRGWGKPTPEPLPPLRQRIKRRLIMHLSVTAFLIFVVVVALIVVEPLTSESRQGFLPFQSSSSVLNGKGNNASLISQQAATATAVTQDGFDPGANVGQYAGIPAAPLLGQNGGGLNRFFYGQCTYWANMRYHQLTGLWVPWLGNAAQWVSGAYQSGWVVSGTPHVPSIIVLQPWVQSAGSYGHVAIVEKINPDGSVLTSNWNWAGNWSNTTYVTFYPGDGVSFVWAPGQ